MVTSHRMVSPPTIGYMRSPHAQPPHVCAATTGYNPDNAASPHTPRALLNLLPLLALPSSLAVPPPPQHLREQHQLLQPVYTTLCTAYPSYFKAQMFAWEQFLWAAELWYAYAISVQLQAGGWVGGGDGGQGRA